MGTEGWARGGGCLGPSAALGMTKEGRRLRRLRRLQTCATKNGERPGNHEDTKALRGTAGGGHAPSAQYPPYISGRVTVGVEVPFGYAQGRPQSLCSRGMTGGGGGLGARG